MSQRASRGGPVAAAALLGKVTGTALRKRGFAEQEVVRRWADVVGAELAKVCQPEKLTFPRNRVGGGTLHIRVGGAAALRLQHLTPQIIERINTFYGYRAVDRLHLMQMPLPEQKQRRRQPPRPLLPAQQSALEQQTADVADDGLREVLRRLGRAVLGQDRQGGRQGRP